MTGLRWLLSGRSGQVIQDYIGVTIQRESFFFFFFNLSLPFSSTGVGAGGTFLTGVSEGTGF